MVQRIHIPCVFIWCHWESGTCSTFAFWLLKRMDVIHEKWDTACFSSLYIRISFKQESEIRHYEKAFVNTTFGENYIYFYIGVFSRDFLEKTKWQIACHLLLAVYIILTVFQYKRDKAITITLNKICVFSLKIKMLCLIKIT